MGDASFDKQQLSREAFRLNTFDGDTLNTLKRPLAKAGFYYTRNGLKVKCFSCDYELDAGEVNASVDVVNLHREKAPNCKHIKELNSSHNVRSKKFLSYDSLRYEKERLETYIEWPLPWLTPRELAADGFYYLRTSDHCACVFCRGIVGAWEHGDTPRGEHQRHFPHCPFIRGQPVGNVPTTHSDILEKLPLDGEESPIPPPRREYTNDEAGAGAQIGTGRLMPGSYPECRPSGISARKNVNLDDIGIPQYTGPKRKDYVTVESRVKSFARWPERVVQKPDEMAQAGFFYCGLSDHVRCFHCGSGLRNWETEDKPWDEHARWYPHCSFVIMKKGQEFIDKVRREKPPYLRGTICKGRKPQKASKSSGYFKPISEEDLEPLMKLDIIQAISCMGFPAATIRQALRQKLEQTGLPFFSLEPCIEAVLQIMENETRQTLRESTEDEATARQNDKMAALHIASKTAPASENKASATASTSVGASTATNASSSNASGTTNASSSNASGTAESSTFATVEPSVTTPPSSSTQEAGTSASTSNNISTSPSTTNNISTSPSVASTSSTLSTTSDETASTPAIPVEANNTPASPSQADTQAEAMETEENTEAMETQVSVELAQHETPSQTMIDMRKAEETCNYADEVLKPGCSGPSSLELKGVNSSDSSGEALKGNITSTSSKDSVVATMESQRNFAEELERIREIRSCKICMDAEMEVVFLPCAHMATCSNCAVTMDQCPICRNDIKYTIKPIIS